jgi:hypothetical protein
MENPCDFLDDVKGGIDSEIGRKAETDYPLRSTIITEG